VIDNEDTRVTVDWQPGGKAEPSGADVKVSGLGGTAYWLDLNQFGTLQVKRTSGLVKVVVKQSPLVQLDKKAIAIAVFKAAAPRLPK
jgi:hypothetical protein